MFAGGMTIAAPGMMPEAVADLSVTDGALSVSTTTLQGAAVLEIVVNDPDYSATDTDIPDGPTVSVMDTSYDMVQSVNGKWYLYVVDASTAALMDADDNGLEFGILCAGLGNGDAADVIATSTNVYAEIVSTLGSAS